MSDAHYQFGFIGAGHLAGSVIQGLLKVNFCPPTAILASEPNEELRRSRAEKLGIHVTAENAEVAEKAKTIFVGVKPAVVLPVLRELGDSLANKLVVSLAAGIRIASMEAVTDARIMRVLTNTPSAIARAATAYAAGARTTDADRELIGAMFSAIGVATEVSDDQIDAVTALGGSGPAFIYSVIEALAAGGEKNGLDRDAALKLAAQMTLGAAELALTSGKSPEQLRGEVATPGGTTAAGLAAMEMLGARDALIAAITAAVERGREMSRESA
ncbi:MAG: pyrroline-5-carboxylate reductase [Chthoniobacterales bacterium]